MATQILTILNFQEGRVEQSKIPQSLDYEDIESLLVEQGYSLENIEFMVHDDQTIYPIIIKS